MPPPARPPLFGHLSDQDLLCWGVPTEWLAAVRRADEDTLLTLAEDLPAEAAEALIELPTGGTPRRPQTAPVGADPFAHPDAQRRFRVMQDVDELARALEFPWDQWTVFLHPAQRLWVERDHGGAARVSGSAGTGKTIVALHRAVHLARSDESARVLLTTFTPALAHALHTRASSTTEGAAALPAKLGAGFLWSEWVDVVDAWQVDGWEAYRDFKRLGRKTRLSERQRAATWQVFGRVRDRLQAANCLRRAGLFTRLANHYAGGAKPPFEYVVVDEAQDISPPHLAKGLEFRCVAVMACDDEALPLQTCIDAITDEADLKEVYDTERQAIRRLHPRPRSAARVGCRSRIRVLDRPALKAADRRTIAPTALGPTFALPGPL